MEKTRIYFNSAGVALGTIHDYYGDYYASEDLTIPEDLIQSIPGMTHHEIHEVRKAARLNKFGIYQ